MHIFSMIFVLALVVPLGGCKRSAPSPVLSLEELTQGDFVLDRSPPFIPSETLKAFLDQRVCIDGEYAFTGDGTILLTRPHERILTPLRAIICNPRGEKPSERQSLGRVCGILRIRPENNSAGRLETVYQLDD